MPDEQRDAALDYHRLPDRRASSRSSRPSRWPTSATCRSPIRRASPRPATRSSPTRHEAAEPHRARQSGRRDHQRHRRAGARRHRPARRQAGDGRQGGPVQEVRRHRRVRHRARRARPGQAGRHHRRAGADLRRHQPRGHQGAGMLRRRGEAARSACASRCSTTTSTAPRSSSPRRSCNGLRVWSARASTRSKLVTSRRRRRGARLPRPAGRRSACRRENIWVTDIEGVVYAGPHRADGPVQGALCARDRGARDARRGDRRRRHLPRPVGAGVLKPEMVRRDGGPAADLWRSPTRCRRSCRRRRARSRPDAIIATGRSDYPEPGQQRALLSLHLPRRARRRRHHDQRGDEDRLRSRRWPRWRAPSAPEIVAARLWRRAAGSSAPTTSSRKPFDPRLIVELRAGGRQGGDGQRRGDAADRRLRRLPPAGWSSSSSARACIMRPVFERAQDAPAARGLSPTARTSACCAPCRRAARRGHRAADPDRPPGGRRGAHRAPRPAPPARRRASSCRPADDPRYDAYWRPYHELHGAAAA